MSSDLAAIVERDREWIEQEGRLVLTWRNVRSGEQRIAPHATDPDGPSDRRVLLGLLREARDQLRDCADTLWGEWDGGPTASAKDVSELLARLAVLGDQP